MSECIHGVPLDWNCNACSDECHPNRIMPDEPLYTLDQARVKVVAEIMEHEDLYIISKSIAPVCLQDSVSEVLEILQGKKV